LPATLSIIIPVYNSAGDGKLEACLSSCLNQTIANYEIIAVDDKSSDNSIDILNNYQKLYPNTIKVHLRVANGRQGAAKNDGLRLAKGKWVGFVDSDDIIACDMYEKLIAKAEATGADVVGCDYSILKEGSPLCQVSANFREQCGILDEEKHKLHIRQPGSMVVKIYKRELICKNRLCFPEGIFYEDNCAGLIWSVYYSHFEYLPEALYFYRMVPGSSTHVINKQRCRDRMTAMELLQKSAKSLGFYDKYKHELDCKVYELHFLNTLFSYVSGMRVRGEFSEYSCRFITEMVKRFKNLKIRPKDTKKLRDKLSSHSQEELVLARLALNCPPAFWLFYACLSYYRIIKKTKLKSGKL